MHQKVRWFAHTGNETMDLVAKLKLMINTKL
jgi:hypothetical protein